MKYGGKGNQFILEWKKKCPKTTLKTNFLKNRTWSSMQDPEHMEEILELEAVSSALWPVSLTAQSYWIRAPVKESVFRCISTPLVLPTHLEVECHGSRQELQNHKNFYY